jgi:polyisoprenoid-binding protein YceI
MMRRALVLTGVLGLVGAAGVLGGLGAPRAETPAPASAAGAWSVDPVHSSMVFRIKHMNTAYFYGTFNDLSGTVTFDEAKPEASSVDLAVKIDSVETHADGRNKHLKSASFFNSAEFPTATFKSTAWKGSGTSFDVTGDMTIHGVKKPLTIKLEKTGEGKGQQGPIIGFETTFTIKRSDFGITYMPDGLSDEVKMVVSIEAKEKKGG